MGDPYWADGQVTLYCGDMREILRDIDVSHVGAVIADPPYGETSLAWDRWPFGWVHAVAAAVRESCPLWCFGSLRMFMDHRSDFDAWTFAQDVVWEKHNGSSFVNDRFRRVHELAAQWYRGPWERVYRNPFRLPGDTKPTTRTHTRPPHTGDVGTYRAVDDGTRLARSVLRVQSTHGHAIHPTQKPLGIIDPLLRYSLAPGGTVLDPFAGSCSTLVAAREAGYRAIGIEADEAMCEKAVTHRLAQGVLFGA